MIGAKVRTKYTLPVFKRYCRSAVRPKKNTGGRKELILTDGYTTDQMTHIEIILGEIEQVIKAAKEAMKQQLRGKCLGHIGGKHGLFRCLCRYRQAHLQR